MAYRHLTSGDRHSIAIYRAQGLRPSAIARRLNRSRSTITRELRRNACKDAYRPTKAHSRAITRRSRSRRNNRFSDKDMQLVIQHLRQRWSPEQIAAVVTLYGGRTISHETIYKYIWADKHAGGTLFTHLRQSIKRRRKRYNSHDSRGRLAGKRMISQRPQRANLRKKIGDWEIDTMLGKGSKHCLLVLVDRKSGFSLLGKLTARTADQTNKRAAQLLSRDGVRTLSVTADNGTEFHGYKTIEAATGAKFYFANPHRSWERGTCENTIGLVRQYLPKGLDLRSISQLMCDRIAHDLNTRPRKRHGYQTPSDVVALQT